MEKVIGVRVGDNTKAYPYSITNKKKIIHDTIDDTSIVVFHIEGAQSALDSNQIAKSEKMARRAYLKERLMENCLLLKCDRVKYMILKPAPNGV